MSAGVTKLKVHRPEDTQRTTQRELDEANSHTGHLQSGVIKGKVLSNNDIAKGTIREQTENNNNQGAVQVSGTIRGKTYNPQDTARTTIRETTSDNTNNGNMGAVINKGVVYSDTARTTTKELSEAQTHSGFVQSDLKRGKAYNKQDFAKVTIREQTEANGDGQGQVQVGGSLKGKVYNGEAKATIRQMTERTDFVGAVSHSQKTQPYVYDPENNAARSTVREQTEKTDAFGPVSHSIKTKQICYNPEDVARTTIKEQTGKTDKYGGVSHPIVSKQFVYDPYDVAKVTIKQQTENMTYLTSGDAQYLQNGQGYFVAPLDVKVTQRQDMADYYYVKPATQADAPPNPTDREDVYNMRQDIEKEIVAEGRYPTLSNVKLANGKESVFIGIKKLDQDRLNQYSAARAPTFPNGQTPLNQCNLTSFKNNLPPYNGYFDPSVLSAFNSNPLSQSLNSWA